MTEKKELRCQKKRRQDAISAMEQGCQNRNGARVSVQQWSKDVSTIMEQGSQYNNGARMSVQ